MVSYANKSHVSQCFCAEKFSWGPQSGDQVGCWFLDGLLIWRMMLFERVNVYSLKDVVRLFGISFRWEPLNNMFKCNSVQLMVWKMFSTKNKCNIRAQERNALKIQQAVPVAISPCTSCYFLPIIPTAKTKELAALYFIYFIDTFCIFF